jgi:hypothetical protein
MSDVDTDKPTSEDETDSLFQRIVSVTDLTLDDDETPEAYKERVVWYFNELDDDEYEKQLEEAGEDAAVWVKDATRSTKNNRGARTKSPLPAMDGLDPDSAEPAGKPARKRRSKKEGENAEAGAAEAGGETKKRGRGPRSADTNRFYKVSKLMIQKPTMTADDLVAAASSAGLGYSERSARRVHEAWTGITAALRDAGLLTSA